MEFPAVKLLDYAPQWQALEADPNPFAKVVLAHLRALATRRDPGGRRAWKFRLVRGLYERGFRAEDVRQLFRLIDWLMELPAAADDLFWQELNTYEEERRMPFVTTPQRYGIKQGVLQAVEGALRVKFGEAGVGLLPEIKALNDADKFLAIHEAIVKASSLDEVRQACANVAAPAGTRKAKGRQGKRRQP